MFFLSFFLSFFFLPPDSLKRITGEREFPLPLFLFGCFWCIERIMSFFRVSVGLPASLSVCLSVCLLVGFAVFGNTIFFVILLVCCGRILRAVFVWGRRKLIFVSSILFLCCRLQIFIYLFPFLGFFVFLFFFSGSSRSHSVVAEVFHLWFLF